MHSSNRAGIRVSAGTAIFVLILSLGCGKSLEDYIQKGNSLYASDKFAEAELNYRKALQKDPKSGEAYYRLALAELKQKKGPQAYQSLIQAVQLAPEHQAAKTELANLALKSYLADPQHPKVLYDLLNRLSGEWLKKDPGSVDGLRIKGYIAMEERRPEEAVELFRRALQSNPKQEQITLGLIDALFRNKQAADAEKVGLDFIATDKTAGDIYDALYRLAAATNRPADAESILVRKVRENPQKAEYILQLATHYARVRKKPEMAAALQSFVANPAAGPKAHLEAGNLYTAIGDWTNALDQFNAGETANPKDKLLYQDRIARILISQDKRDEALKILNSAIAQDPANKESRTLRAALLLKNGAGGKSGEAIQELQALVDKNPDDALLKFIFSRALVETGDLAAARAQLLDLVRRRPNYLDAHVSLAEVAFKQGQMTQAVVHAGDALELDPNNFRAQLIRGSALLRLQNLDEAGAILGRLSRRAPQSVDVRLQMASLYMNRGKFPEAEAAFSKIHESNPNEWRAVEGLVETDLAQHRPDKAFARLEQELKSSHGAPQVRHLLASLALKTGKYSVAIENLQQLAVENPTSIDPLLDLANVFRLKSDLTSAIDILQKASVLKPLDPRPPSLMSDLLAVSNRKEEAILQCRRALSLGPDNPSVMNNLAYLLAETGGNLDEALKLARQAVSKAQGQPNFADTLGLVYLKKDQNNDAMGVFGNLVRKYPDNPTFAYHMAMTWYQTGQTARAKAELARALQRRPSKELETSITDLLRRVN